MKLTEAKGQRMDLLNTKEACYGAHTHNLSGTSTFINQLKEFLFNSVVCLSTQLVKFFVCGIWTQVRQ